MNSEKIIDYLSLLGIIDENKINNFLNIFSEIVRNTNNNNNLDINNNIDILKLSLFSFLRNISKNDKNLFELSRNIILSYNKFVTKEFYKKLENVKWILYLKIKKIFMNFLFKIIQYALRKENYESRNKKLKFKNYNNNDEYINNSLKKFHPNESNNFNSNINLNRNNLQNNNSNTPIKSFTYYSSAKNIQQKIPINPQNIFENNNFSNNYFNNNININNNNININNNNINYLKDYYDFYENENNHIERVNEKILNLKVQKMNELEQNCTFSPKINTNYQIKSNIYNKNILYEDNKNDNNDKKMKRSKSNFAHFEKLYNEAKIKTEKQKELEKKNFLNDNNFTFKPTISDNKKYKVKTTFNERTNKSIEIRKKKIDDIKNNIHPPLNENFYFDGKKKGLNKNKYSKEEIIDTLYTKQLEKIKEKQNNYKKLNEKNEKKQIIDWKKKFEKMRKLDIERIKNFNRKLLEKDDNKDNNNNNEKINEILDNNNNNEENKNNSVHNTIPDLNFYENNLLNKNNDSLKNLKKENSLNNDNNNNIEINSLSDVNTANNLSNLDNNKVESEKTETDHFNVEAKSNSLRNFLSNINNNNNKDEKK